MNFQSRTYAGISGLLLLPSDFLLRPACFLWQAKFSPSEVASAFPHAAADRTRAVLLLARTRARIRACIRTPASRPALVAPHSHAACALAWTLPCPHDATLLPASWPALCAAGLACMAAWWPHHGRMEWAGWLG